METPLESDANKMNRRENKVKEPKSRRYRVCTTEALCQRGEHTRFGSIIKFESAIIYNNLTLFTFKLFNN